MALKNKLLSIGSPILVFSSLLSVYYLYLIDSSQPKSKRLDILALELRNPELLRPSDYSDINLSVLNGTKNIYLLQYASGFQFPTGRTAFINAGCAVSNCRITWQQSNDSVTALSHYDAFLINLDKQTTRWKLHNRRPDQVFVMLSKEPPTHIRNLKLFDNYFNWTMTFRSDSDFVISYGDISPLKSAPISKSESMAMRTAVRSSGVNPARGKTKLAVWPVSNCKAESNRQGYVQLLRQFIPIDIISSKGCGGKNSTSFESSFCSRSNRSSCYDIIEQTYKFYLSFENAICKDYVTEKFFQIINRNMVPVVLGGADYASIAPRHSYINALDYSPHQLADYLKLLDTNDTLYAEYFWWKPHYRVRNLIDTNKEAFCDLCEALHTQPLKRSTLKNAKKWYISDSNCVNYPKYDQS